MGPRRSRHGDFLHKPRLSPGRSAVLPVAASARISFLEGTTTGVSHPGRVPPEARAQAADNGKVMRNVVPTPLSVVKLIVPPSLATRVFTMLRPRPDPLT